MKLQDYHLHTLMSHDSRADLGELVADRAGRGIEYIAVTDHADFIDPSVCGTPAAGPLRDNREALRRYLRDLALTRSQILGLRRTYPGMHIAFGAEIGQPYFAPEEARELAASLDFDVILVSAHATAGYPDSCSVDFAKTRPEPLLEEYYASLKSCFETADFDVVSHLNYPCRYLHMQSASWDESLFDEVIHEILRLTVRNGKSLEINVSPLYRGFPSMPPLGLLKDYRSLGGKQITIGTDDHRIIYGGLPKRGIELARAAGFTAFTAYSGRRPELIKF